MIAQHQRRLVAAAAGLAAVLRRHEAKSRNGPPPGGRTGRAVAHGRAAWLPGLRLTVLALAFVVVLAAAGVVRAHANLERADPPPGAVLDTAPGELRLWFSESLEPRFSSVEVLDRAGQKVPVGGLQVVDTAGRTVVVPLPALSPGTYTVSWRVLSRVDGHVTQGLYPLTIGLDQAPPSPPTAVASSQPLGPLDVLTRWFNYLAMALTIGVLAFGRLVAQPALASRPAPEMARAIGERLRYLTFVGVAGLALGALLLLWMQAGQASGAGAAVVLQPALWLEVLETRFGPLWALRLASSAALSALALALLPRHGWPTPPPAPQSARSSPPAVERGRGGDVRRSRDLLWLLVPLAAGLLLLTTALSSHAVASQAGLLAWVADWLHLLATSIWVGGLAALALTLAAVRRASRSDGGLAAFIVRGFSRLALASVVVLVVTGGYQTWLHVRTSAALVETPYGQVLLAKLLLLVPVFALGAYNYRVARCPSGRLPAERVRRAAWLELGLLVTVLGLVGALASLAPGWDVYRLAHRALVERAAVADLHLTLRVDPGAVGVNTFDLEVREADGWPAREVQRVVLRFRPLLANLGESELRLAPVGEGRYRGQGGHLSLPGYWQVEMLVRRAGREDARTAVRLGVPSEPGVALPGARASPTITRDVLIGALVLVLGIVLVLGSARLGRRRTSVGVATLVLGFVLSLGGAYAATTAWLAPGTALVNPFPPDEASLQRGAQVYAEHCATCHGMSGRGDGPLAPRLSPPPVDLRLHVTAHSEAELFTWLSRGVPGMPMPAFEGRLSVEDRWHVVNYIRTAFDPERAADR